jgi:hypothetical protein
MHPDSLFRVDGALEAQGSPAIAELIRRFTQ